MDILSLTESEIHTHENVFCFAREILATYGSKVSLSNRAKAEKARGQLIVEIGTKKVSIGYTLPVKTDEIRYNLKTYTDTL